MEEQSFKYYAFISYSHKDKKIAKKLQKWLEHYHLPSDLFDSNSDSEIPEKLSPVFLDESDLVPVGPLKTALRANLDRSNYLIVVCSPHSAQSVYVNDEVQYFIESGKGDRVIPLIVDGIPHAGNAVMECFPPAIRELPGEKELLGISVKVFGEREAFLRVIAGMLKLDVDDFISRDVRERKRKMKIYASLSAVAVMIIGLLVWYNADAFRAMYDADTQCRFGAMYSLTGDYDRAIEWYGKAAANGHATAQYSLGEMYHYGRGVKQDYVKARKWYEKAAENGDTMAQYGLGELYESGLGTKQDYTKAIEWYEKAAANGSVIAQGYLGSIYQYGRGVEQNYDRAMELYKKASDKGYSGVYNNLGLMYFYGQGVEQDYAKAFEWFNKSAVIGGYSEAKYNLGYMYQHGLGVEQDYAKAREWYEKAANNGLVIAQYNLGNMYQMGEGVEQDYAKALEWFEKAADKGYAEAQKKLGYMYQHGLGVKQDYEEAREWYKKAAGQ